MLLSCCNYKKKDVFKILTRQLDRGLPVLLKKDYRHTTSVTGLLSELGWLPLSERRKHSRLTFSTRRLITFKSFLWITSQFHYGILDRASNENKFMSLPVRRPTDAFKYSFFLGPLPIGITSHWLFASRSRFSLSMEV